METGVIMVIAGVALGGPSDMNTVSAHQALAV